VLQVPADGAQVHVARDREEEVAGFARRVKAAVRRARSIVWTARRWSSARRCRTST
jgi:hypothetical protein